MCVCLDFLKPKTRINEKVGNKMHLAKSKMRFIYGPLRSINENALLGVFELLPLVYAFTKISLTQTHKLISSLTPISSLCSSHRTPSPPRLPASLDFCALLHGKLLPLLLLSFFVFFNVILIFFFFFNFISV